MVRDMYYADLMTDATKHPKIDRATLYLLTMALYVWDECADARDRRCAIGSDGAVVQLPDDYQQMLSMPLDAHRDSKRFALVS